MLNTHVHLPPNFSAFQSVEDAVQTAVDAGVGVLGASNFHDQRIYARFRERSLAAGIMPLFGVEVITVDQALLAAGTRVNDPANPGRIYLCGKGINPFASPGEAAVRLAAAARVADVERARLMALRLRTCFAEAGLKTALTYDNVAEEVAERAGVPPDWVVLQERHLAQAFQEALFLTFSPERRPALLARAFGGPSTADPENAVAIQDEVRSRLMKADRPAFVPESPVSFDDAVRLILEMDGIPSYPTLGDGVEPVCPWEDPPSALADRIKARGIYAAELIPTRNRPEVVDAYVSAFRAAGIIVTAGTEHNTHQPPSIEPRCVDGSLPSHGARDAFWEGACVIVAHQHLRTQGLPGYVDQDGELRTGFADADSRIRWFAEVGADVICSRGGPTQDG
ncbi:MAG: hypothetical protein ACXWXV_07055 [Aeromicrobium sp.]